MKVEIVQDAMRWVEFGALTEQRGRIQKHLTSTHVS